MDERGEVTSMPDCSLPTLFNWIDPFSFERRMPRGRESKSWRMKAFFLLVGVRRKKTKERKGNDKKKGKERRKRAKKRRQWCEDEEKKRMYSPSGYITIPSSLMDFTVNVSTAETSARGPREPF